MANFRLILENFGGKLPLNYYNHLNESLKTDEFQDGGSGMIYNPEISNPNSYNRSCAWPVVVKSDMAESYQVRLVH